MSSKAANPGVGFGSGWKVLLGVAVSALLVWWVLRDVDLREVGREIRGADPVLLAAAVALATSGFAVRALRWNVFLEPIRPGTSFRSRWATVNIGFGLNNVLPWRMGELARVWSLARLERLPMSATLGSLVVERVMDALAVFALLLVAVLHPSFPTGATIGGQALGTFLPAVAGVIAVGLVILLLLLLVPEVLVAGARRIAGRFRGGRGLEVVDVLESFLAGLGALRAPALLVRSSLWSVGFWMWNAASYLLAMRAFGIDEGYVAALFLQSVITLGVALPAAPGYVGTYQVAAVIALHEVYGVAEGTTLAFAFGFHLAGFLPVTLLGLWYANRVGVTLAELRRVEAAVEAGR